ncbi:MAG: ATP-binding cassette domain-containing protein [Acholeplasmataceae bacterium]|nr:ATP-binding cassette domain-containing protein [Acholeplasmataceae bacterium]
MDLKIIDVLQMYENKVILDHINLEVKDKSGIVLIGPSGAGKSTLLRLLAGIEDPISGEIILNQHIVTQEDKKAYYKRVGFVFQAHNLFPHLTILRNITIVLEKVHHMDIDQANKVALKLLEQFELIEHKDKIPAKISGGQAQRASIIRSLAISPEVVFLDEPTSALDPILSHEVLKTILKLRVNKTNFMIVTHEIEFAKKAADYVVFMEDGKIVEHGNVDILDQPKTKQLQNFIANVSYNI